MALVKKERMKKEESPYCCVGSCMFFVEQEET